MLSIFLLLALAAQPPAPRAGVSVQMAVTQHAQPLPQADQPEAVVVALTRDGKLYNGITPITVAERQGRLEKARRLMREQGIDALMLTGGTSMVYFTGIQWGLSERLLAAFIQATGKPFLVTPKFEEERAMEQVELGPMTEGADVYEWEENEDPYTLIANGLRTRVLPAATIAVEPSARKIGGGA